MAPYSADRSTGRFGRPQRNHSKTSLKVMQINETEGSDGPPLKKRKYVPGGPGGGGRYIEIDVPQGQGGRSDAAKRNGRPARNSDELEDEAQTSADPLEQTTRSELAEPAASTESMKSAESIEPSAPAKPVEPVQLVEPAGDLDPGHPTPAVQASAPPPSTTLPPVTPRPRRGKGQAQGRYTSSTAAALALQQGDGYKPREERGWEEFHPDLDIEARIAVFTSEEVDGVNATSPLSNSLTPDGFTNPGDSSPGPGLTDQSAAVPSLTPLRRRPGRPARRPNAIIDDLVSPDRPKVVPPPGPDPREKLTLPKPSFRTKDPFERYDHIGVGKQNYVDRAMASVGYQETDLFIRHDRRLIRMAEGAQEDDLNVSGAVATEGDANVSVGRVEYDMDEQDQKWLEEYNAKRREDQLEPIKPAIFEITMTKIEKEWHALEKRIPKPNPKPPQTHRPRSSSAAAVNGEAAGSGEELDSKCAICDDGDCENSNAIVFCDGCDLAVHQECYGVPFIPEGQWLCRKCQLIGRGDINCIFCPNTEGAFKQTTSSKWSHILCAIWIPEVSIGNPSLMEPVTDVEKVPKSRWKLQCYICRQKMGASIQCSNKNCYLAFHVTCARRAQLYLKMKSGHGSPTLMDSDLLKAFCDKHAPPDWRREHGTDAALAEAVEYYRQTMEGRVWGDSQAAALSLDSSHPRTAEHLKNDGQRTQPSRITLNFRGNKRKRLGAPRTIWRLPSGAPVIPQVVLNSVAASLQRFSVLQRKQYAEDACKYWTLKREARRGAALLKRLQLQLETFSSMEMTRRDYVAMGATGGKRLQRRIDFGERLYRDLDRLRMLCDEVKKREREKLKDAEILRTIVDIVYFPISPILWPIFERAQSLDGKGFFRQELLPIRQRLEERYYTSVATFSADVAAAFSLGMGVQPAGDTAELQMQISGRAPELSLEQREKRKLAKRIIKAIQPALEDAIRKESELNRRPYEKELKELDLIFENSALSRRYSVAENEVCEREKHPISDGVGQLQLQGDAFPARMETATVTKVVSTGPTASEGTPSPEQLEPSSMDNEQVSAPESEHPTSLANVALKSNGHNEDVQPNQENASRQPASHSFSNQKGLLTPPLSFQHDQCLPLSQGGIPWYMQPFDPLGTTIHEERWTGREVMRGMSEELSEIDEEELNNLVEDPLDGDTATAAKESSAAVTTSKRPTKIHKTRRHWRGFK